MENQGNDSADRLPLDPKRVKKLLSAIIEGSYDGIYVTDGKANTLIVNKSYERISGLERKKLIGKNMNELVSSNMFNASGTLMALESRKPVTMEQQFKTGKRAVITSTPLMNRQGEIVMVVTNVRDITELHELKSRLMQKESEYEKNTSVIEALRRELSREDMAARLAQSAYGIFLSHGWPSNVREMESVIERALVLNAESEAAKAGPAPQPEEEAAPVDGGTDVNLKEVVQRLEMKYMSRAYQKYGNVRGAAKSLGMDAATFVRKRQKYGGKG